MPSYQQIQRQVNLAKGRQIGSDPLLETVKARANQSLIPNAFSFGVAILSVEGRIADPAAFRNGWRGAVGPEVSPWQIHPQWHSFAQNTPVSDFAAYTDYAYGLLEQGFLETGTLFGAARRYNSFNACEAGRTEACRNGKDYAGKVVSRLPKIQEALKQAGFQVGPDVTGGSGATVGGGTVGGGGASSAGFGVLPTLLVAGALGGTVLYVSMQDSAAPRSRRSTSSANA